MTDRQLTQFRTSRRKGLSALHAGVLTSALALAGVSGLAVSASAAGGMQTAPASAPINIDLMLASGLVAYDLVWSDHTDAARKELAEQAIAMMTDPAAPYILRIPQLTAAWRPLPADFSTAAPSAGSPNDLRRKAVVSNVSSNVLSDMFGNAIDRNKARLGRLNYERDIEKALIDIIDRIREARPGALLTIDRFVPPQNFGAATNSYRKLLKELDFVTFMMPSSGGASNAKSNDKLSARSYSRVMNSSPQSMDLDRAFGMAGAPADMFVLVQQNGVWMAVDDDPLPEALVEGGDDAQQDWGAPNEPTTPAPAPTPSTPNSGDSNSGGGSTPTPPPVVVPPDNDDSDDLPEPELPEEEPIDQTPGSNNPPPDDDDDANESPEPDINESPDDNPVGGNNDGPSLPQPPVELPSDDDDDDVTPPSDDDDDDNGASNPNGGGHNPHVPPGDDVDDDEEEQPDDLPEAPSDDSPAAPVGVLPLLVPGSGFNGPTPQLAQIGSGPGADAKAIARWDVVPYQTFDGQFLVGVMAFHINGIDRVEFSVDGGPWVADYDMEYNPRTGVWEYFAAVNASDFDDGQIEVRAIAYPNAGVPRVLAGPIDSNLYAARVRGEHSMILYSNHGGSLKQPVRWVATNGSNETGTGAQNKPFRTIAYAAQQLQQSEGTSNGGVIYLKPGDYAFEQPGYGAGIEATERWLTIAGAPGQSRDAARITSAPGNGLRANLLRVNNLTIYGTSLPGGPISQNNSLWMDNIVLRGTSPSDGSTSIRGAQWPGGLYSTNVHYDNLKRAVREGEFTRNALITNIGGDVFREMRGVAVNIEVRNLLNLDGTHNDLMQFYGPQGSDPFENLVIYGLKAVENIAGQSFFVSTGASMHRDIAVVNYISNSTGGGGAQWGDPADHVLFWNYTILNQSFVIRDGGQADEPTYITNFSLRNSVLNSLKINHSGVAPLASDPSWARNNHYIDVNSYGSLIAGEDATSGGTYQQLFVNPNNNNFRPKANSVLTGRVSLSLAPADANGAQRPVPGAVGALDSGN